MANANRKRFQQNNPVTAIDLRRGEHNSAEFTSYKHEVVKDVSNGGDVKVTRKIAGKAAFDSPAPLRVNYPKNWGASEFNLMKQFLNNSANTIGSDDGFFSKGGDIMGDAVDKSTESVKRAISNMSGEGAQAGFLNVNQTELLFQGIDFREIQISHVFAPDNEWQLNAAINMIHFFKLNSAPEWDGFGKMTYPMLFDIEFATLTGGKNTSLFKLKPLALTNIEIDYTPDSIWSTFHSGHPVKFTMSLNFKEIELLTRDDFQGRGLDH